MVGLVQTQCPWYNVRRRNYVFFHLSLSLSFLEKDSPRDDGMFRDPRGCSIHYRVLSSRDSPAFVTDHTSSLEEERDFEEGWNIVSRNIRKKHVEISLVETPRSPTFPLIRYIRSSSWTQVGIFFRLSPSRSYFVAIFREYPWFCLLNISYLSPQRALSIRRIIEYNIAK